MDLRLAILNMGLFMDFSIGLVETQKEGHWENWSQRLRTI
jgi:hypothetical protein